MTGGLELQGLTVTLDGAPVVRLQARVAAGQVLTVMGPSGSGKSTALAAIMGTLRPPFALSGRIVLDGQDVTALPPNARRIGLLFQDDLLFPHLSVGGNLAFALPARHKGRALRQRLIDEALDSAGLSGFADRDPATLSGGQRARVALLRTLLAEPRALLLDEPFARLDALLRDQIRAHVFDRARRLGLPVILVTHDPEDARVAGGPVLTPQGAPIPGFADGGEGG